MLEGGICLSKPIYIGYYRNKRNLEAVGYETDEGGWAIYLSQPRTELSSKPLFVAQNVDEAYDQFYEWAEQRESL